MAWNDAPPSSEELKKVPDWASTPPTDQELGKKYVSPGETPDGSIIENSKARFSDPNRWLAFIKGTTGIGSSENPALPEKQPGYVAPVAGTVPFVVPEEAIATPILKAVQAINASPVTRIAAGTAVGAGSGAIKPAESNEERIKNIKTGAATGGVLSIAGEAIPLLWDAKNSLFSTAGKYLTGASHAEASAYGHNPEKIQMLADALHNPSANPEAVVALQNEAKDAIVNSRAALRAQMKQDSSALEKELSGKTVTIDPRDYLGVSDKSDAIINNHIQSLQHGADPMHSFQSMSQGMPAEIEMPANTANNLKRIIQQEADFAKGSVLDPVRQSRAPEIAQKAFKLRETIEGVSSKVADINHHIQEAINLESALRQGQSNPIATLTTASPDKISVLSRAETRGAGGLLDLGDQIDAAKLLSKPTHGIYSTLQKEAGKYLMNPKEDLGIFSTIRKEAGKQILSPVEPLAGTLSPLYTVQPNSTPFQRRMEGRK